MINLKLTMSYENVPISLEINYAIRESGTGNFDQVSETYTKKFNEGLYNVEVSCSKSVHDRNGIKTYYHKTQSVFTQKSEWISSMQGGYRNRITSIPLDPWHISNAKSKNSMASLIKNAKVNIIRVPRKYKNKKMMQKII
jgi:hypothetical protein